MNLEATYVVLDDNANATPVEVTPTVFEDLDKQFDKFVGKLLIAKFSFEEDWPSWEIHPKGDEIVCLLSGTATMILKKDDKQASVELSGSGDFVVVPCGTWHTAKIKEPTSMIFVTPGEGTENVTTLPISGYE